MANVTLQRFFTHHYTTTSPYGNNSMRSHYIACEDNGVVKNSLEKAAIKAGDVVIVGQLPEGFCMADAIVFLEKPLTGNASLGFAYTDGEDHPDIPQDDKYFFADKDVGTKGRIRADGRKLVILPKDANLILTCAAAHTKEADVKVAVFGELVGNE